MRIEDSRLPTSRCSVHDGYLVNKHLVADGHLFVPHSGTWGRQPLESELALP
jgi:hypothetical protein